MRSLADDLLLEKVLEKAYYHHPISKTEIIFLLLQKHPHAIQRIFAMARMMRRSYFGERIYLYGFVYFSTYCKNNCTFCLYRKSNLSLNRYRKSREEVMETVGSLVESGVHLIDLTMGEDPAYLTDDHAIDKLLSLVGMVKRETGLPIMVSPGVVSKDVLKEFKSIGVDWYACYQETHNRELYQKMRTGQGYDERWNSKRIARRLGILTEEGLLTGIGDTTDDIAESLIAMGNIGAEQVRVMSFVPQSGTPLGHRVSPSRYRELMIIAVMRLLFPDRLIPASLDVDSISGLEKRLDAGANVVTSIIPPQSGFAGVSNASLDIAEGNRTVSRVKEVLENLGLSPATLFEYKQWICTKRENIKEIIQVADSNSEVRIKLQP